MVIICLVFFLHMVLKLSEVKHLLTIHSVNKSQILFTIYVYLDHPHIL